MPSTAQIQADRDAYAAAHPYVSALAGITGGSMPFLATGGAADELGLLGRGAAMAGTGAVAGGLPSAVRGDDASAVAGSALSAPSSERAEKSLAPRSQARQASWLTPFSTETWWLPRQASLTLPRMRDTMRRGRKLCALLDLLRRGHGERRYRRAGNKGMHSGGQGTLQILRRLANPGSEAVGVPTGGLEEARQSLSDLIRCNPGTTEAAAVSLAKSKPDAFATNPPSGAVTEGDVQPYLDQLVAARGNWAASKRSGTLTGALDRSEGAADGSSRVKTGTGLSSPGVNLKFPRSIFRMCMDPLTPPQPRPTKPLYRSVDVSF